MKKALLIGATSDMAIAMAEQLAALGTNLCLASRKVERLAPHKKNLSIRYSVSVDLLELDVTQFDTLDVVKEICANTDLVVYFAGYMGDNEKSLQDSTESLKVVQSCYTGAVVLLNQVAEVFKTKKTGSIVGVSSVAGDRGRGSNFIYGSSKAGFSAYLDGLRNYMHPYGVQVLTVKPGFVSTKMTADLDLPGPLTVSANTVSESILQAVKKKKSTIYISWKWRFVMWIIKSIPEAIFVKLKL